MKVILLSDVKDLGKEDEIVDVKPGYARNFLIKKNLAVEVNKSNLNEIKVRKKAAAAKEAQALAEAQEMAETLEGQTFELPMKVGENGRLYGTLTAIDVENALAEAGYKVDKRNITLEKALRNVGKTTARLRLHREVIVLVNIVVVPK
ncbi:MAG TPA: 50S ribosomal protein L9 [Clostridiaceae bacterium]|nr:50S ribosomal protein L9 [Clostridiaceae bacterium]